MSATVFDSGRKTLVVGSDDICGYYIAKTLMKHTKCKLRVGYMFKDCPLTKELERRGAEIIRYDLNDSKSMEKMFEGVHCAIVVPPVYDENYTKAKNVINVAVEAKELKNLVLISLLNANRLGDWDRLKQVHEMEREFESKMNKWEKAFILRKSMPMEAFYLFRKMIQDKHQMPWTLGNNEIAPVSLCDVGKAVMCLFQGHRGEEDELLTNVNLEEIISSKHMYCLTGREKVSGRQIAEKCGQALNTRIELKSMKVDEYIDYLKRQKEINNESIKFLKQYLEATNKGYLSEQTHDLESIIGKKPMTVEKYFEENRNDFMPRK